MLNGIEETKSKDIIVNPIKFADLSDTPIATYIQQDNITSYKTNSERYKTEGKFFSDSTCETVDIAYVAFAVPNADGTISFDSSYMNELLELRNKGIRLVVALDGANNAPSANFLTITNSDTLIETFTTNIINLVETYKFDGVDIDWESTKTTIVVAQNMNKLVTKLREKLNLSQDSKGSNYLLSAAVPASSWGTANDRFDFATLDNYLDVINLMSYDVNNNEIASHLSPLYKSKNDNGWGFGCDYGVNRLKSFGVNKAKILIGTACYGKTYNLSSINMNQTYPGLGQSGSLFQIPSFTGSYSTGSILGVGLRNIRNNPNAKIYHEYDNNNNFVGSYILLESSNALPYNLFITFDSDVACVEKIKYALGRTNIGMMFWAYPEDHDDYTINAVANYLKNRV